jgi:hypothetical protein
MTAAAMTAAVAAKGSLLTVARSRVRRRTKKKTADEPSGATDSRRNTVGTAHRGTGWPATRAASIRVASNAVMA